MVITGLLIRTKTGCGEEVAARLRAMPGVEVREILEGRDIVTVMEASTTAEVQKLVDSLNQFDMVIGVFPAYTYTEPEP